MNQLDSTTVPGLVLEINDNYQLGYEGATPFKSYLEYEPLSAEEKFPEGSLLVYTGGTTGKPKAVVWDEPDLLDIQMYSTYGALGIPEPQNAEQVVRIAADTTLAPTVTLPLAPFIHATALFNAMNTFLLGGTVVVLPSPSLSMPRAAEIIRKEQVTGLIVAGDAVVIPLLECLEAEPSGRLEHLRSVMSSGMRLGDESKARMHAMGNISIIDLLASTEGAPTPSPSANRSTIFLLGSA